MNEHILEALKDTGYEGCGGLNCPTCHLMARLTEKVCPDGCLADELEAIALEIHTHAGDETNLTIALAMCMNTLKENE